MPLFTPRIELETSVGRIEVYLTTDTVEIIPLDDDGLAKREVFEVINGVEDLADLLMSVAELPQTEAESLARELTDRVTRERLKRRRRWPFSRHRT